MLENKPPKINWSNYWEEGEGADGMKGPPALNRSDREGSCRLPKLSCIINLDTYLQYIILLYYTLLLVLDLLS